MKRINSLIEKNFYELLDVELAATKEEIDKAYDQIMKTYDKDSIALHSLFSPEDKKVILKRVDEAYKTLKDPSKRSSYNMKLGYSEVLDTPAEGKNNKEDQDIDLEVEWDYRSKESKVEFKRPLIVFDHPRSMVAEQYRILCARLQQVGPQKSYKTFAITSALKGEGKTTTSVNLAYIMAHEFKKKVLLIDGDMRNPSMPSYLEVESGHCLINILKGEVDLASTLLSLNNGNFNCLPTADASLHLGNPSEFLSSPKMKRLIKFFKSRFDYVIIDSPPILPVVDMNILAEIVDGVVLVVKADSTPKDLVLKALKSITTGEVVGIALNNANISSKRYSYYKY